MNLSILFQGVVVKQPRLYRSNSEHVLLVVPEAEEPY